MSDVNYYMFQINGFIEMFHAQSGYKQNYLEFKGSVASCALLPWEKSLGFVRDGVLCS